MTRAEQIERAARIALATLKPFSSKPIGGEGSDARRQQLDQIEAWNALHDALAIDSEIPGAGHAPTSGAVESHDISLTGASGGPNNSEPTWEEWQIAHRIYLSRKSDDFDVKTEVATALANARRALALPAGGEAQLETTAEERAQFVAKLAIVEHLMPYARNELLKIAAKLLRDIDTLLAASPSQERKIVVACSVAEMKTSAGSDFYVHLQCDGREITPHAYKIKGRAEYDVAEWKWFFGQGERPHITDFDTNEPARGAHLKEKP